MTLFARQAQDDIQSRRAKAWVAWITCDPLVGWVTSDPRSAMVKLAIAGGFKNPPYKICEAISMRLAARLTSIIKATLNSVYIPNH